MSRLLAIVLFGTSLTGCVTSNDTLRSHIAIIQARVDTVEKQIEASTPQIGANQRGLVAQVGYRPLVLWTRSYNARPVDQKTVTFRQTERHGYIIDKVSKCWPAGKKGYYVEVAASDSTKADLVISGLSLRAVPGALRLAVPLDLTRLESRVHGHLYHCIGGGEGTNVFANLDRPKHIDALLEMRLGGMVASEVPYEARVVEPSSIGITITAHIGWLGNLGIPVKIDNLADQSLKGSLSLAVKQSGTIGPLPDGSYRTYRLQTVNPSLAINPDAILLQSDLDVIIAS